MTMNDIVLNIGINVISAVITSVLATIFIYYKFLRKIPEMTEKKIDDMLNARLNYETANHNAVLEALNPDNRELNHKIENIWERQIEMDTVRENVSDTVKPEAFIGMAESLIEKNGKLNGSLMQAKLEMQSLAQELQTERGKLTQLESHMRNLKTENMKLIQLKQQYKEMLEDNSVLTHPENNIDELVRKFDEYYDDSLELYPTEIEFGLEQHRAVYEYYLKLINDYNPSLAGFYRKKAAFYGRLYYMRLHKDISKIDIERFIEDDMAKQSQYEKD